MNLQSCPTLARLTQKAETQPAFQTYPYIEM